MLPPLFRSYSSSGTGRSCPCWPFSSVSASTWLQLGPARVSGSSKSHPRPSHFCVSPQQGAGWRAPERGVSTPECPRCPLRASVFSAVQGCHAGGLVPSGHLHKGVLGAEGEVGGRVSGGGGTQQALGRLHLGPGCDPDPSLDADRNVLSHPSILLVILLNVSLNTLPTLALRVICQALKKAGPEVRGLGSPSHTPGTPSAGACAGSRNSKTQGWGWEEWRPRHTQCPQGDQITGPRIHPQMFGAWGSR